MKMRAINHITAAVTVIANILVLIAVLTGMHTLFGIIAASVSLAVSLGMYLRVVVGMVALKVNEQQQEPLMCFAIAQKKEMDVVTKFAHWVLDDDMDFKGAKVVDLLKARDENGRCIGFWLTLIGTKKSYEAVKKELGDSATVLDRWPINRDQWADNILCSLEEDEDFDEEGNILPELKG